MTDRPSSWWFASTLSGTRWLPRAAAASTTPVPGAWSSGSAASRHRLRTCSTPAASTPPGSRRHGSYPSPATPSPGRRSLEWSSLAPSYCTSSPPRKGRASAFDMQTTNCPREGGFSNWFR